MHYLLSQASQPILERLAAERTLCAFDFDGTLAPIVERPEQAQMRPKTRRLLTDLARAFPCVILSGRKGSDVAAKIGEIKVDRILGNHGAEIDPNAAQFRPLVEEWRTVLRKELDTIPDVWIEDKGLSLAVHYRQSDRKTEARRKILSIANHLRHAHVFAGKQVVNLTKIDAPNKGRALVAERERLRCDWVLFVGDDENDEDAFAIDGNLISTRIGRSQNSRARYYLRNQLEIDDLMERLDKLRASLKCDTLSGAL